MAGTRATQIGYETGATLPVADCRLGAADVRENRKAQDRTAWLCPVPVRRIPREWTFLGKHREQGHSGSDLGQATREAELRRIAQVRHRVARQTVAGAAFTPAAPLGARGATQQRAPFVEGDTAESALGWS